MTAFFIITGWFGAICVLLTWNYCAHFSGSNQCLSQAAADDCGGDVMDRAAPAPVDSAADVPLLHGGICA